MIAARKFDKIQLRQKGLKEYLTIEVIKFGLDSLFYQEERWVWNISY